MPRPGQVSPSAYAELLDASRTIIADGKKLTPAELSRRTGRSPQSCSKVLERGWHDRWGKQLPWAAPIRAVLEHEARAGTRDAPVTPAALDAANGDPALAVARKQIAELTDVDIEGLSMVELLHTTSRSALGLGLRLSRGAALLADKVETEMARQLLTGEIDLKGAVALVHRVSESMRNTSALAKAALDAELAVLTRDPAAGNDADKMTMEEAEEALQRINVVLAKRAARQKLSLVPDPDPDRSADALDAEELDEGADTD